MKYVLLLMTLMQFKLFYRRFKEIFTTRKQDEVYINNSRVGISESFDKDLIVGAAFIMFAILALFIFAYYSMIAVYVGSFIISIFAFIFIITSFKSLWKATRCISDIDNYINVEKNMFTRLFSVLNLIYIGYFIYYLITTW